MTSMESPVQNQALRQILHIHDLTVKLKRSQMKRQVTFQVSIAGTDLTQDCSLLPFFLQRLFHLMAAGFIQMHKTFNSTRAQNQRRVQLRQQGRKLTLLLKMWMMKVKSFLAHQMHLKIMISVKKAALQLPPIELCLNV
jgi:hypothetical protein